MKTLLVGALLLLLAGCLHGELAWSDKAAEKDRIAQRLEAKHMTYTEAGLEWIYQQRLEKARDARLQAMAEDWAWNGIPPPPGMNSNAWPSYPPPGTSPYSTSQPRMRTMCMQYGTLGQGGQLNCY